MQVDQTFMFKAGARSTFSVVAVLICRGALTVNTVSICTAYMMSPEDNVYTKDLSRQLHLVVASGH